MADIRINALATTATTSASDDYIAIDGAANGTRKLSVYSPTYGGNLTVSGTGTSDFSGAIRVANAKPIYAYTSLGATASMITPTSSDNLSIGQNNVNWGALNLYGGTGNVDVYAGAAGLVGRFNTSGNVLLGTTTDSSNGKLQLATHSDKTGGIGFGTDCALFRGGANTLALTAGTADVRLDTGGIGTGNARLLTYSGSLTISSAGGGNSFYLQTGGTTALTLDSSQNLIMASGAYLQLGSAYTAGAPAATGYVTIKASNGTTYKVLVST